MENGANVNRTDNDEWAPIHIASYRGHLGVVKLLHEAGAGLNMRIDEGATPLFMASQNGHEKVAKYLLENGKGKKERKQDRKHVSLFAQEPTSIL